MKERTISAIIALLIVIPIFLIGGVIYNLAVIVISLLGLREFLKVKSTKKDIPLFINFLSYIILTLIVSTGVNQSTMVFSIDYKILAALIMTFLFPTVLYHDKNVYSVEDAFYLMGGVFFLGVSFLLLIIYRNISMHLLIYLLMITIFTDTYAYIMGRLVGKHKLLESISPNKTVEGMVLGTLFGTFIATLYYMVVVNPNKNVLLVIVVTIFLSIIGQFGDLAFSAIKRYFGKKDFSNIMPGHGGILDRLDSIIFVMLGFIFFISIM